MPRETEPTGDTPIRLQRILFATDFSPSSAMALPYAAAIARRFHASIYVAHVIPDEEYAHMEPEQRERSIGEMKTSARQQISNLLTSTHFNDIPFQIVLDHGDIMAITCSLVERFGIDLIVAGSHGRHGLHKLLSASIDEAIACAAVCPSLLVGPNVSIDPQSELHLQRILLPTDFSPESRRVLDYAFALAKAYRAHLYIVHIAEDIWSEPLSTKMSADAFCRARLLEFGLPQTEQDVEPEFLVEFGPPETLILEMAEKRAVQLIVVSVPQTSHPHLSSRLPGPMAYNLASHALCPVLAVRNAAPETVFR